jgi:diaminohydroxyphosphoribosylaminopyrimidine deaminase/5-amino-6-(5-phosphoribosylamino)uracil reductase
MFDHQFLMDMAIKKAWEYQGLTYPNPAVGAVIVGKRGEILAINAHQQAGGAHAEVLAIRDAFCLLTQNFTIEKENNSDTLHRYLSKHHQNIFQNCSIYVTLEPCNHKGKTQACSQLLNTIGIKNIYIGQKDLSPKAMGGGAFLKKNKKNIIYMESIKAKILLEPFLEWSKSQFVFFKWAQHLNGSIEGSISSIESRILVHKLRAKIDLLLIGGNTVRIDRPILDTRLIKNIKNPDIMILTHTKIIDKTIPLFKVQKREVTITQKYSDIKIYPFVMIEGGSSLLATLKVKWLLVFISMQMQRGERHLTMLENYEIAYSRQIGEDLLVWMRKKS